MARLDQVEGRVGNDGPVHYDNLESLWEEQVSAGQVMTRLLIVGRENGELTELSHRLERTGFTCALLADAGTAASKVAEDRPDLILAAVGELATGNGLEDLIESAARTGSVPVIALVARDELAEFNVRLGFTDFVLFPGDDFELLVRIRRQLHTPENLSGETMEHGGLVIDFDRCEVTVDGELVELTFREYELLKYMASHKGRVHTRESLLNQVWGYDYFGGDRTVDVHVRRLRSKIETRHKYIDTVRNIGYRFHDK